MRLFLFWRSGRDSNPREVSLKLISREIIREKSFYSFSNGDVKCLIQLYFYRSLYDIAFHRSNVL